MFKIYLKTIKYQIKDAEIDHHTFFVIEDEEKVKAWQKEINIYSDELPKAYHNVYITQKKKGKKVTFDPYWNSITYKEWKEPDVKLIISISYEESMCSMKQLLKLDADKVISYLKQEEINFTVNS